MRRHWPAALVAIASTVLMTWPLSANAGHRVLRAIYYWDAYTNAMIMGSRVDALLGRGSLSLSDNYFFAPLPNSMVFNENLFGLSLLFAPFYLLSKNPLWAYNLTLLVSLGLSVFFTYLLVLRLTGSRHAGLLAGVAFAFCPYVLFEIGRIQLVATQWIPAAFLLLHRAVEEQRPRDIIGFWLCILLQIGTCLYNTMFLLPLLALAGVALLLRERPPRRFYYWFAGSALSAAAVALLIAAPYFAARSSFNLERSVAFASSYDGKLAFFGHVSETNRTLTALHHEALQGGAHEEIAFPGFSVLLLSCLALAVPTWRMAHRRSKRLVRTATLLWLALLGASVAVTLLGHSMLPGALVFGGGGRLLAQRRVPHPFSGMRGVYFGVLLLALVLFLGFEPLLWNGAPVRGLYYYFHRYFPGFDGIRKVSRQALLTSFGLCILAGFGAAWLFAKLRDRKARRLTSAVLLAGLCYELCCFPHPTEPVWAGSAVPPVLRFAASLPADHAIALAPQNDGQQRFRDDAGMALHNYLALYHGHRFVNGQSSWQPPVAELALRALQHLPDDGARRALLSVGTRELVLFGADLPPEQRSLAESLAARPREYQRLFQQGTDSVFRLLEPEEPSFALIASHELPPHARLVPSNTLRAQSPLHPELAALALDGDRDSDWTSEVPQETGQYFEVELREPRTLVAFEIEARGHVMEVPISYRLTASEGGQDRGVVAEQSVLRFYRDQVYAPERFVFREALPKPIRADHLRISVAQPVPGFEFSIGELRLYDDASQ